MTASPESAPADSCQLGGSFINAHFYSHSQNGAEHPPWVRADIWRPNKGHSPTGESPTPAHADPNAQGATSGDPLWHIVRTPVTPNAPALDPALNFPPELHLGGYEPATPDASPARQQPSNGAARGIPSPSSAPRQCAGRPTEASAQSSAGLSSAPSTSNGSFTAPAPAGGLQRHPSSGSSPPRPKPLSALVSCGRNPSSRSLTASGAGSPPRAKPEMASGIDDIRRASECAAEGSEDPVPEVGSEEDEDVAEGPTMDVLSPTHATTKNWRRSESVKNITDMLESSQHALVNEMNPELTVDGTQGTYFVSSVTGERIGVFKPWDEEVCNQNNPRGLHEQDAALKSGIPPGGAWKREIAAYRLDHGHFAGVPETVRLDVPCRFFKSQPQLQGMQEQYKVGSFQRFIPSDGEVWDVLPGQLPLEAVHRIAVLDIRLCNSDRHGGNVLFVRGADGSIKSLVPIDHAACAPTHLEEIEFEWLMWPQAKQPFSLETLQYIRSLDAEADARILQEEVGLSRASVDNVRAATILLKEGAERGLTARRIGELMRRPTIGEPSDLEDAIRTSQMRLDEGDSVVDWDILKPKISAIVAQAANAATVTAAATA
eukprot:TRINITY_DN2478_c0_g2_i1.p1 TRINITY_DN2478_c0_g2~~TRINITY_DN2478_c0_g2_i1.p1  ORF type:complete len:602 (+),score=180.05 TRINITY_DN2478_c0_g2_i1:959-2764(+)